MTEFGGPPSGGELPSGHPDRKLFADELKEEAEAAQRGRDRRKDKEPEQQKKGRLGKLLKNPLRRRREADKRQTEPEEDTAQSGEEKVPQEQQSEQNDPFAALFRENPPLPSAQNPGEVYIDQTTGHWPRRITERQVFKPVTQETPQFQAKINLVKYFYRERDPETTKKLVNEILQERPTQPDALTILGIFTVQEAIKTNRRDILQTAMGYFEDVLAESNPTPQARLFMEANVSDLKKRIKDLTKQKKKHATPALLLELQELQLAVGFQEELGLDKINNKRRIHTEPEEPGEKSLLGKLGIAKPYDPEATDPRMRPVFADPYELPLPQENPPAFAPERSAERKPFPPTGKQEINTNQFSGETAWTIREKEGDLTGTKRVQIINRESIIDILQKGLDMKFAAERASRPPLSEYLENIFGVIEAGDHEDSAVTVLKELAIKLVTDDEIIRLLFEDPFSSDGTHSNYAVGLSQVFEKNDSSSALYDDEAASATLHLLLTNRGDKNLVTVSIGETAAYIVNSHGINPITIDQNIPIKSFTDAAQQQRDRDNTLANIAPSSIVRIGDALASLKTGVYSTPIRDDFMIIDVTSGVKDTLTLSNKKDPFNLTSTVRVNHTAEETTRDITEKLEAALKSPGRERKKDATTGIVVTKGKKKPPEPLFSPDDAF